MQNLLLILSGVIALLVFLLYRSGNKNAGLKLELASTLVEKELKDVELTEDVARSKFSSSLDAYRKWKSGG